MGPESGIYNITLILNVAAKEVSTFLKKFQERRQVFIMQHNNILLRDVYFLAVSMLTAGSAKGVQDITHTAGNNLTHGVLAKNIFFPKTA